MTTSKAVVWVLTQEVEYEGAEVWGVFPTRIQAQRAIDKHDPPPSKDAEYAWKVGPQQAYRRTRLRGITYQVTRYKIGVLV